jgi:4-hydroxy-3-polyprenylbenzoate decarboxylase
VAPIRDLHQFIAACEAIGQLKRIKAEVDPYLEIAEITDRVSKMPGGGYALLFENVKGSTMPVLTNTFGSMERICLALGVKHLDEAADKIRAVMKALPTSAGGGLLEKLALGLKMIPIAKSLTPKIVEEAPCQEVVHMDPDLTKLPVLTTAPKDGGPFITLTSVITKDPVTGQRNIGMYRLHVYDKKTTGMHWHKHKDGQRHYDAAGGTKLPVAVALGGDPVTIYSGSAPLPPVVPELMFSGFLRGERVELVKCKTVPLEVPAHAEIIIEGYVDTAEPLRLEGPFGDHTGFYSPADLYPVFHVTCITHKKNAIYPATLVAKPPQEDVYLGKATERLFLPLAQMVMGEILDYNMPPEGTFHNVVLVKIKKSYPGQGRKLVTGMFAMGLMMLSKAIIVLDADVDLNDYDAVYREVMAKVDPRKDIFFLEGPVDDLDHSAPFWRYGSKVGIDATTKWPAEAAERPWAPELPPIVYQYVAETDLRQVDLPRLQAIHPSILDAYTHPAPEGKGVLAVRLKKREPNEAKHVAKAIWAAGIAGHVVVVDEHIDVRNLSQLFWYASGNYDPKRDMLLAVFETGEGEAPLSRIAIDATRKGPEEGHPRPWPEEIEMSDEIKALVDRRWAEYGID